MKLKDLIAALNAKLRGHYSYYGVTFNSRSLYGFFMAVMFRLFKWLNRRGGKIKLNWAKFSGYVDKYALLETLYQTLLCIHIVNLTSEEPDAGKPLVRICGGAGR